LKESTPQETGTGRLKLNKRLTIIGICFLISAVFWLLIALSHDYSATLTFPVRYLNLPGKKVILNELPAKIKLTVKTTGFRILSYDFRKTKQPIEVDVMSKFDANEEFRGDGLTIPTRTFSTDFNKQIGNEMEILSFQPDSIVFLFSDKSSRKVPVKADLDLSFAAQYDTSSSPYTTPDSVVVSGPPSVLRNLKSVSTVRVSLKGLRSAVRKEAALVSNRLLNYSDQKVTVSIPVEKFTEGMVEITVHPLNVKQGFALKTFPEKVKVRYQVALSKYNSVNPSMFDAVVDAAALSAGEHPDKLTVNIQTSPGFIRSLILEPEKVDYIIRKQ
jgi:YbbR domain-containing protein